MTNPLKTPDDYELFIHTLSERYPVVRRSTVRFVRRGAILARVVGEIHFDKEVRLVVRERIVYHRLPAVIDEYGYEVWQDKTKLYWYDSQPTQTMRRYRLRIRITNISHQISNATVFRHPVSLLLSPISPS